MSIEISICPRHMRNEVASWSPSYPKLGTTYRIVRETEDIREIPLDGFDCTTCFDFHLDYVLGKSNRFEEAKR